VNISFLPRVSVAYNSSYSLMMFAPTETHSHPARRKRSPALTTTRANERQCHEWVTNAHLHPVSFANLLFSASTGDHHPVRPTFSFQQRIDASVETLINEVKKHKRNTNLLPSSFSVSGFFLFVRRAPRGGPQGSFTTKSDNLIMAYDDIEDLQRRMRNTKMQVYDDIPALKPSLAFGGYDDIPPPQQHQRTFARTHSPSTPMTANNTSAARIAATTNSGNSSSPQPRSAQPNRKASQEFAYDAVQQSTCKQLILHC
jgi:hypothetical protein